MIKLLNRSSVLLVSIVVAFFSFHSLAIANDYKEFIDDSLDKMFDAIYSDYKNDEAKLDTIVEVYSKLINMKYIFRTAFSSYWHQMSNKDKSELFDVYKRITAISYRDMIGKYNKDKMIFKSANKNKNGGGSVIYSLDMGEGEPMRIEFVVGESSSGKLMVKDMIVGTISLRLTEKDQVDAIGSEIKVSQLQDYYKTMLKEMTEASKNI